MPEAPTCQRPPVGPPYSPAVHNPTNVPTPVTLKLVLVVLVVNPVAVLELAKVEKPVTFILRVVTVFQVKVCVKS